MRPACVVCRASILENKYSNIFSYETTRRIVLKFLMEHYLTPGSQNYAFGTGRISNMAAVTKKRKNNKNNLFSRTTGYYWLNFFMEYQWNIGIQNYKNETKTLQCMFVTVTYFLFTSVILLRFVRLKIKYSTTSNNFSFLTVAPIVVKFHMKHDQSPGLQNWSRIQDGRRY